MDASFYTDLPQPLKDLIWGLAADGVAGLFKAAGGRVARRFATPPRQAALERAMAHALAATVAAVTSRDEILMEHLIGLLGPWLRDEEVQNELCVVLDPGNAATPDIDTLTTAMDRLELDADLLSPDHTFAEIIALFADNLTDALDQEPELQGEVQTRLLRHMAEQLRAQLRATEAQTARIDAAAASEDDLQEIDVTDEPADETSALEGESHPEPKSGQQ